MRVETITCPNCGSRIEDLNSEKQFCPFCGQSLFIDDETEKITYKKIDEARIKEAEVRERVKLRELGLRESEINHKHRSEERQNKLHSFKIKAIAIGIVVIILAFVVQNIVLKHRGDQQALLAYEQALQDGSETVTLPVNEEVKVDELTLSQLISPASELISYKYYYTSAGLYEDSKKFFKSDVKVPFTTDKSVYLVDGIISVGIDIDQIEFEIDEDKKIITVTVPYPKIMSHEVDSDSFQYYDIKNSVFNSSNLADFAELEAALKKEQEDKLLANTDFWDKAKDSVTLTLDGLLNASEKLDDYQIKYKWKSY